VFTLEEKRAICGIRNCQSAVTRTTRESTRNELSAGWQHCSREERVQIHLVYMHGCIVIHMDIMALMLTQYGRAT